MKVEVEIKDIPNGINIGNMFSANLYPGDGVYKSPNVNEVCIKLIDMVWVTPLLGFTIKVNEKVENEKVEKENSEKAFTEDGVLKLVSILTDGIVKNNGGK